VLRSLPRAAAFLVVAASLGLCGCVDRLLVVRSEPSGARLWIDGVERGTTPYAMRYVHPRRFDLRLEKEGYESVAAEVVARTTWDAVPGPDFFAENGPSRIHRRTEAFYRMTPLKADSYTEEELKAILDTAKAFRAKSEAAAVEPGTPPPTRPHAAPAPPAPSR
jgi:hypothetical protein